jgi:hypothetical protein
LVGQRRKISQRCFAKPVLSEVEGLNMTDRAITNFFCDIFYSRIDNTRLNFTLDIPGALQVEKFLSAFTEKQYAFD